ncbi:MAG: hypothetical protein ACOZIN_13965 [Myxococcota bacterium]
MKINSDFSDLLSALNEAEARYLIVGAYAVAWYAEPRFTKDLDIWVEPSPDNAQRVLQALQGFGAPLQDLTADDLSTPGMVFQMGVPPNRIDLLTEPSGGISFEDAWAHRVEGHHGEVRMWVIGLDELLRNKRSVARPQDLRDVRALERVAAKSTPRR